MAQDSGGSDDSDLEGLTAPSQPPLKPPALVTFYVQQHRTSGIPESALRLKFTQSLGKQEKQRWKTKHKKARKRYNALLALYCAAHPDFNADEHEQRQQQTRAKTKTRTNKRRRSDQNNMNMYDSSQPMPSNNAHSKRRRTDANTDAQAQHSIDDLFRDINAGSKRVVRDPDKFRPSDEHKMAMQTLVADMRAAAKRDWECNLAKQPAINTSQMLDTVVAELSKKLFYKYYLDETALLEALRDWMHPLPDGSLPALKIRTELFRILQKMELHDLVDAQSLDHYLQLSEDKCKDPSYANERSLNPKLVSFSKTCMLLWAHPQETMSNKVLLRRIMERWIRSLTGSDSNYSDLREEMRESQGAIQERYKILQKQQQKRRIGRGAASGERKRAAVPEKAWHDFAINPGNLVDVDGEGNPVVPGTGRGAAHPLQDRMNKTFKKSQSSKQYARPSITGRKTRK